MEIQKLKRVPMQDVRKIIIISSLLISYWNIWSQEITGLYQLVDPALMAGDIGITYDFKRDGSFENNTYGHLGKTSITGGDYHLAGDTLILKYKHLGTSLQSEIKLKTKKELKDPSVLFSNIKVFNSKGEPQSGVNLLIKNKEKEIVTGFSSDKEGEFPPISIYDNYIQYFTLSWIAHREVSIHTDTLFGYTTNIEVYLKDSSVTYNNPGKTIKFLITNRTAQGLYLKPLNGPKETGIKLRKTRKY